MAEERRKPSEGRRRKVRGGGCPAGCEAGGRGPEPSHASSAPLEAGRGEGARLCGPLDFSPVKLISNYASRTLRE